MAVEASVVERGVAKGVDSVDRRPGDDGGQGVLVPKRRCNVTRSAPQLVRVLKVHVNRIAKLAQHL